MPNVNNKTVKVARSELEQEKHAFHSELEEDMQPTLKLLEERFKQTFNEAIEIPDEDENNPDSSSDKLFSSASKVIDLEAKPESLALIRGDDYYEADESSEQMNKFASVAISHESVVSDSKVPWERHFFPNKVIVLPSDKTPEKKLSKGKRRKLNLQEKKRWAKEEHRVNQIIEKKLALKLHSRFNPNRPFQRKPAFNQRR